MANAKMMDVQLIFDISTPTLDGPTANAKITAEIIAAAR